MIALIFISAIKKSFTGFSWGSSSYNVFILCSTTIQLPTTANNIPDYAFMELLITAMQKVVIKNVVNYLDTRIDTTARVIK